MAAPAFEPIHPPAPALADERVRLRPWHLADVDAVTAACQDSEIARWVPIPWPYLREHAVGFIERTMADWADGVAAEFALTDPGDGRVVGALGLRRDPSVPRGGIIGYWVATEARGHGVATSATRLVAHWALVKLRLERVSLYTYVGNIASQRVAQHAGFRFEGTLRNWVEYRGQPRDAVMFSLIPEDLATR